MHKDVVLWTGDVGSTYLVDSFLKSRIRCSILFCLFDKDEIKWAHRMINGMRKRYTDHHCVFDYCCTEIEGVTFNKEDAILLGFINVSLKTDDLTIHVGYNTEEWVATDRIRMESVRRIVESIASLEVHNSTMKKDQQAKQLRDMYDDCRG